MRPPKARTWSCRRRAPIIAGSSQVPIAGLVCHKPGERSHLLCRVRDYSALLTAAYQQLRASLIVCWDNLNTHISLGMREFLATHPDWLGEAGSGENRGPDVRSVRFRRAHSGLPWPWSGAAT